ncbi:DUF4145 domain-containing protein [Pseudomonas sp. NMI760_13]|uniref:DUF4145 domain-containing protein n=1 Tax=Pseudomonas sp. NMI760_13 TaxID=2903147 RepID=UPI001E3922CD|nr:DUF4145 domain-containing protein [Pseudomonas sp. NMI760_13]MCE0917973.1 DUF4145 domain-containing protein [Pseudomonas sp. NMI760_13]
MTALFKQRFGELEQQLSDIERSTTEVRSPITGDSELTIPSDLILNWSVKVRSLLERACGVKSTHLQMYLDAEKLVSFDSRLNQLKRMKAVFLAAKEDFEGGYLNSLRNLVQAEVFSNELEQAEELLSSGYATAAAVIAGVVLETSLRDLCSKHAIGHGTLNRMNDDLAKAGAYNTNQKKQITSLSAIRNSAAHGKPEEFTADQVKGMIDDVQRFLLAQQ